MRVRTIKAIVWGIGIGVFIGIWIRAAHAVDLPAPEISLGVTSFQAGPDGIWYQEGLPHTLSMTGLAGGVSLAQPVPSIEDWLKLRIGYQWLGQASERSLDTEPDNTYDVATKRCMPHCVLPLIHFNGHGHVGGFFASLVPQYRIGDYTIFAEFGPYYYSPTWTEDIPNLHTPGGTPYAATVNHIARYQVEAFGGVGITWRQWSLEISMWPDSARGDSVPALYTGNSYVISMRYEF